MLVTPTGISKGCGYVSVSCLSFLTMTLNLDVLLGLSNLRLRRTRNVPFASYLSSRFLAVLCSFERSVLNFVWHSAYSMALRTGKMNPVSARHPCLEKLVWPWLVKASLLVHLHVQHTITLSVQTQATSFTLAM